MTWFVRSPTTRWSSGPAKGCTHAFFPRWKATKTGAKRPTSSVTTRRAQRTGPKRSLTGRSVARKCVARSAFADATSHFEIAMDALDRTPISRERETEAIDLRIEARIAYMGSGKVTEWLDLGQEAERRANAIDDIERKVATMTVRSAAQTSTTRRSRQSPPASRSSASRNGGAISAGSTLPNTASGKPISSPAVIAKRSKRSGEPARD